MAAEKQPTNDVAQIRELIFGDKIREYDRHFQQLDKMITTLNEQLNGLGVQINNLAKEQSQMHSTINERFDEAFNKLHARLENLQNDLQQKFENLNELKVNRADLGNFLIELGMRLKGDNLMSKIMEQNNDHEQR